MTRKIHLLRAKDSYPIDNQVGHEDAIRDFIKKQSSFPLFAFQSKEKEDLPDIATFDFKDGQWRAGRLVGDAHFKFKRKRYHLQVRPRFGDSQLYRMLEVIFNIRLMESESSIQKQEKTQGFIKHLIALLWLNLLSKANRHGIPRVKKRKQYKGSRIKGRINIRKSILPYYRENQIVSEYQEKEPHQTILQILSQAYRVLYRNYGLEQIQISVAAQHAISHIQSNIKGTAYISRDDYHSIQYSRIYESFRPVVDLSWSIIQNQNFGNQADDVDGQALFIDMAEVWEVYLRTLLKNRFTPLGWKIGTTKFSLYANKDFVRAIVPDIVMQKGEQVLVWDAKYKRMKFKNFDYDRSDFFQIHTYIHYLQQYHDVIAGGLLYPITNKFGEQEIVKNQSQTLFGSGTGHTQFVVNGIDLTDIEEVDFADLEVQFLERVDAIISQTN